MHDDHSKRVTNQVIKQVEHRLAVILAAVFVLFIISALLTMCTAAMRHS